MKKNNNKSSRIARLAFFAAVLCGLGAVAAGLGTRYRIWDFRIGLDVFRWSAYGGAAAALLSLLGLLATVRLVFKRGFLLALFGLAIAGSLAFASWHWMEMAKKVPAIHDITTDTENPPKFVAILPLRRNASNPPDYGGPAIAAQQDKAYPDIKPLALDVPPGEAFDKALAVARKMGWKIVEANRSAGRIEAVATTFWFGFRDDIVIRVEKEGVGSRVDIRSLSRVGISDVGTNAKRIRTFLAEMKKQ
ncbi:MAG: DUF1499 domain-containing protein [Nitrospiraceae bacterium]|nr:DUF1499 domain-containing protein [Nitrospiraceae bacterium]